MPIIPWLTRAGPFDVEHAGGIPHFNQAVTLGAPRAGVLHTTEGATIEGAMGVFRHHYAPHFVVGRDASGKVRILQLVQIGTIGAALETHNWLALAQVELVGFSRDKAWFPDEESAAALAALMAQCAADYQIPLSHPWPDDDWGRAGPNPHRASQKFGRVAGWFGHQDVESPDVHWDPGCFQWSRIFDLARKVEVEAHDPPPPAPPRPCACATPQVLDAPPLSLDLSTVEGVQRALDALGWRLDVDGIDGGETDRAIKSFQMHVGIAADGVAGPVTIAALEKELSGG